MLLLPWQYLTNFRNRFHNIIKLCSKIQIMIYYSILSCIKQFLQYRLLLNISRDEAQVFKPQFRLNFLEKITE